MALIALSNGHKYWLFFGLALFVVMFISITHTFGSRFLTSPELVPIDKNQYGTEDSILTTPYLPIGDPTRRIDLLTKPPTTIKRAIDDKPSDLQRDSLESNTVLRIPNIVHYVMLSKSASPLDFTEYISILSAYKYQDPDQIWIHCNQDPFGRWWDELMLNISWHKLRVINVKIIDRIGDISVSSLDHASDLTKIQILLKYGGIYLDSDVIVVQSLDPLRTYPTVMGQESDLKLSTAVIMAEPNSSFLELVYRGYLNDFQPNRKEYNSGAIPYKLSQKHQDLVFVDDSNLVAPAVANKYLLYTDNTAFLDWRELYAVHLMFHGGVNRIYSPSYIIPLKNLIGRLLRRVYYGSESDLDPYLEHVVGREKLGLENKAFEMNSGRI